MKELKGRPFTLIFLVIILAFLVLGHRFFLPDGSWKPIVDDGSDLGKPSWKGIIDLWDIPYVAAGTGSHTGWLNQYIRSFEKRYPGVYINLRTMPPERLTMYLQDGVDRDFLPDIISLDPYGDMLDENTLVDLSSHVAEAALMNLRSVALSRVQQGERLVGIPWMMGVYGLYLNNSLVQLVPEPVDGEGMTPTLETLDQYARKASFERHSGRRTTAYYGFCTYDEPYSHPLLGMIYDDSGKIVNDDLADLLLSWHRGEGVVPADWQTQAYDAAYRLFVEEQRAGILLGDSRIIHSLKRLQEAGRGFEFSVYPIPGKGETELFTDQIAAYGLLGSSSPEKQEMCLLFLTGLLEEEQQRFLKDIGMFSVLTGLNDLYDDEDPMSILEKTLPLLGKGPSATGRLAAKDIRSAANTLFEQD